MNMILLIIIISLVGPLLGSILGVFKRYSERQVHYMLSFAAGVMVFVSVLELLPESYRQNSFVLIILGVLLGGFVMHLLNEFIPHYHHSHRGVESKFDKLKRLALFIFIGIFIHNLPEGIAVGIGALPGYNFSVLIALAIAIHDIPEAICVAAPLYYTSGHRLKSFLLTFLTVVPTIVGFLVTYYFFKDIPGDLLGFIISATAGVMLYISFWELLPEVARQKKGRVAYVFSFFAGAVVVLLLQILLK